MLDKIKILFFIENSSYGGGEKNFSIIIKNLLSEEFEIYCAAKKGGIFYENIKNYCQFFNINISLWIFNLFAIWKLRKIIIDNNINILFTQGARADFIGFISSIGTKVKFGIRVPMLVDNFDVPYLKKNLYFFFHKLVLKYSDFVITVSANLKEILINKYKISNKKIYLIKNCVDSNVFNPEKIKKEEAYFFKRYNLQNKIVIGAFGRLEWQKGFEYLIKAIYLLKGEKEFNDIIVLIGGKGSLEFKLKEIVEKLELSNKIFFTGEISRPEEFLSVLDIFIIPSLLEGQPLVLLEAMAMRKAIIATNIFGITETLNENMAILVEKENEKEIANAIIKLLRDKFLFLEISQKAFEESKKYSLDIYISQYIKVFKSMT